MDKYTVLIRAMITEKSLMDAQKSKFAFLVANNATKSEVRRIVEEKFAVHVTSVATSITKGRKKRAGPKRTEMTMPNFKKATVTLKAGEKIDLFDIGGEKK